MTLITKLGLAHDHPPSLTRRCDIPGISVVIMVASYAKATIMAAGYANSGRRMCKAGAGQSEVTDSSGAPAGGVP